MADEQPREDPGQRAQDPFVERMRPDPSQPSSRVLVIDGLLGDSDRPGYRRLYFTQDLNYYAEFRAEDVLDVVTIPPEQGPFAGLQSSRVTLRREATIETTYVQRAGALDEFDLDVRLGVAGSAAWTSPEAFAPPPTVIIDGCGTEVTDCRTCETCRTRCGQPTCATCQTRCGQPTCAATCATCQTQCGQPTCATCQTCRTRCGQFTCEECGPTEVGTCLNTHCNTCRC
jgi:hypothetical protein